MMQKLTAQDAEAQSADTKADNIAQLRALFPELLTESANGVAINVDVLKQLVGDATATDAEEKYGLNWHGKRRARQLALTPSTGTLRPCQDESVDWDTTQNLMIEGDNLEVLKLLQKSYAGKVKLIYIDPPYNTGKDFVYPDNFQDNIKNYLELTGQVEGGRKISSNTEASGRFHTDWLNMMYPRLKLARSLLREDGVIFVSIDDSEVSHLRRLCDEILGEENFVGCAVWQRKYSPQNDAKHLSALHEYVAAFARNADIWTVRLLPRSAEALARYKNPDNDPRGDWKIGDLTTKTKAAGHSYPITSPTGKVHLPTSGRQWGPSKETFDRMIAENRIWFGNDGNNVPALKQFLTEVQDGTVPTTLWLRDLVGDNQSAVRQLAELEVPFDSPKPSTLIEHVMQFATTPDSCDLVLDFFAGSGTTGHAVMAQNAADGGNRRYILVQLPEPLDPVSKDQNTAADFCDKLGKSRTIAEITKERLRRAGAKIKSDPQITQMGADKGKDKKNDNNLFGVNLRPSASSADKSSLDVGFRVFKLDTSNIRAWNPDRNNLEKTLFDHEEHILPGRTEADIVYELLLKLGLDLCVPIESRSIAGKMVGAIGGGVLLACLSERITAVEVEALAQGIVAWHKELAPAGNTTCVFRDSAFENDIAKSNLAAILEQYGIATVRSL